MIDNANFYQGLQRQVESLWTTLSENAQNWMTEKIANFLNLPATYTTVVPDPSVEPTEEVPNPVKDVQTPLDYQYAYTKLLKSWYYVTQEMKDTPAWAELTIEFYKKEFQKTCIIKSTFETKTEEK